MLSIVDVREDKRHIIPAVTRVDGTGQLQAVHQGVSPRYDRLMETFGKALGGPIILNTSFNLKGELIVNSPPEAFNTFSLSGMDVLVLGDHVIEKTERMASRG